MSDYDRHVGAAKARGERWAEAAVRQLVAERRDLGPWPPFEDPKARALAFKWLDGIGDKPAREKLARACHAEAARRYAQLVANPEERQKVLVQRFSR